MKLLVKQGKTSKLIRLFIRDSSSATGAGLTGLVFNSAGLTAYYIKEGQSSATSITLATMTVGTWASGGFKEIDATNMPGWYEFGVPDAALSTGASVGIHFKGATNMAPLPVEIQLVSFDPDDAVRLGLTALPNAAAGATGGLSCKVINGGTAQAGAAGSITLATSASTTADLYNGMEVVIVSGTGAGQSRRITAYSTGRVATVDANWITNPDNTSVYEVTGRRAPKANSALEVAIGSVGGSSGSDGIAQVQNAVWNALRSAYDTTLGTMGAALGSTVLIDFECSSAGGASTIHLTGAASATDDFYNDHLIVLTQGTGVDQARWITDYDGTTKVATVHAAWVTVPDTSTNFVVLSMRRTDAITGAVGSVTGSVGSIASGGITASSYAAGAITASAIATDAIGAAELAADAVAEIADAVWDEARSGHTTAGSFGEGVASVQGNVTGSVASVTGNVSGNVTGSVGSVATGGITAASIAADAIGASELASDAVAEIADAVWDEATSGHTTAGTFGRAAQIVRDGTAQAGAAGTITLDASASATDDFYNNTLIFLVGGTGAGQARIISDYVGSTKVATVNGNWATAPDNTSVFVILPQASGVSGGGTCPTEAQIADAVWDEARSGHTTAGTFGQGVASVQGNVTGSVGSVGADGISAASLATDAGTEIGTAVWATSTRALTDKAGFSLSPAGVQAIWDALTSALSTASSIGKLLVDNINATISSRATPAQVNTEVLDVLTVDTFAEPSAVVGATATLKDMLNWVKALCRNKITQTSTTQTLRNDADNASIATAATTDDGTTFTRAEWS